MASFRPEDEAANILAAIVESSDDSIIGVDLDARILTWNRGATRLYGYTAEEMRGRPLFDLVPERERAALESILARVRAGERVEHYETVRLTRDGRLLDVSQTVSSILDAAGQAIGFSSVARDITARRHAELGRAGLEERLRVSEGRWRAIVESAVDAIVVIDARGLIEAFNPAAVLMFGYSEQEVMGRNIKMVMPAPYRDEHDGYLGRYLTTGEARIIGVGREVTGMRKDGTTFPLHLSVGEMIQGGERKFTGILHDLSARVQLEEQLREQAALARVGEMAAVIAHEVKNPLAGVRGAVQIIGSRLPEGGKDAGVITEIVTRIDELTLLINDLLLFARPPRPRPLPIDVTLLVAATAELLNDDPALQGVQLEIGGSALPILGDAGLLKIVFLNLMVNGAQAMQGRGTLRVSMQSRDRTCEVVVADSGPGIPRDIYDKIFTPFFTTKSRGTGLGLPTAKRLVEAHGGTISVACPPEGGTTVTVRLPAQDAPV